MSYFSIPDAAAAPFCRASVKRAIERRLEFGAVEALRRTSVECETTNAGRLFEELMSVNGKETGTMSPRP